MWVIGISCSCVERKVHFRTFLLNMERRTDFGGRRNDVYSREPARVGGSLYGDRDRERGERRGVGGGRRDDPDEQRRKMFCGGLSVETSKETVETYFSRFGPLQEVIMVPE